MKGCYLLSSPNHLKLHRNCFNLAPTKSSGGPSSASSGLCSSPILLLTQTKSYWKKQWQFKKELGKNRISNVMHPPKTASKRQFSAFFFECFKFIVNRILDWKNMSDYKFYQVILIKFHFCFMGGSLENQQIDWRVTLLADKFLNWNERNEMESNTRARRFPTRYLRTREWQGKKSILSINIRRSNESDKHHLTNDYLKSHTCNRLSVPLEANIVSLWGDHWT